MIDILDILDRYPDILVSLAGCTVTTLEMEQVHLRSHFLRGDSCHFLQLEPNIIIQPFFVPEVPVDTWRTEAWNKKFV